jgi:hypothetical protein
MFIFLSVTGKHPSYAATGRRGKEWLYFKIKKLIPDPDMFFSYPYCLSLSRDPIAFSVNLAIRKPQSEGDAVFKLPGSCQGQFTLLPATFIVRDAEKHLFRYILFQNCYI